MRRKQISNPRRRARLLLSMIVLVGLSMLAGADPAAAGDGYPSCPHGGSDCNLCISDVPWQFNMLRDHGEILGFNSWNVDLNVGYPGADHLEGIQRLPLDWGRFFIVSKRDGRAAWDGGAVAVLVHMGSRNTEGLRFRSNRLSTGISQPEDTPADWQDQVVSTIPVPDGFHHGGGMQAAGGIVALPVEEGPGNGRILLYDFNSGLTSTPFATIVGLNGEAGTASLVKLAGGNHMLILGQSHANRLEVFRSTSSDIRSPWNQWNRVDVWESWEMGGAPWGDFQNLNFVTDCNDGQLYLIGTHLDGFSGALHDDYARLYRVHTNGHMQLEHISSRHFYCSNDGSRECNFDASGGIFVGSDRSLLMYATEHDNSAPDGAAGLVEFRSVWPDGACGWNIDHAWVDFYDDSNFTDRGFIFDYPDQGWKNWATFHNIDNFNDKASAVRWCIPPGYRVRIYADSNYKGSYKDLIGNGTIREVNLNNWSFGDKTSSARWLNF
ncbi:MAG TPA: hypothetical protein VN493_29280 [Thermoanaerobaculia bacterium]|nr:hypothetical protein [Thermoanaerobaculia bacterium]